MANPPKAVLIGRYYRDVVELTPPSRVYKTKGSVNATFHTPIYLLYHKTR